MVSKEKLLQTVLSKSIDGKKIHGCSFGIKKGEYEWFGSSGNIADNQKYFIASTTKLFTTALLFILCSQKKIDLKDKISTYLDSSVMKELHIYNNNEFSYSITIEQLLSHTSGLPDYFQDKSVNGTSLQDQLIGGHDQYWNFEQVIERTKNMKPLFTPGKNRKAHYSDTNFQLLGKIIENITGKTYNINCEELIIKPLQLNNTYLYQDEKDRTPKILHYKIQELPIYKAMTSFGSDGGMVSTTNDLMVFIEAFFKGLLFPVNFVTNNQNWNRIFFPLRSGLGIHQFKLPWIFNPINTIPHFIGHSGLSGALAFYSPEKNLFIAGTVNQVAYPDLSFRVMIKLVQAILK